MRRVTAPHPACANNDNGHAADEDIAAAVAERRQRVKNGRFPSFLPSFLPPTPKSVRENNVIITKLQGGHRVTAYFLEKLDCFISRGGILGVRCGDILLFSSSSLPGLGRVNKLTDFNAAVSSPVHQEGKCKPLCTKLKLISSNQLRNLLFRGRPYMTSAKFSGFLTPSPSLVCIWD